MAAHTSNGRRTEEPRRRVNARRTTKDARARHAARRRRRDAYATARPHRPRRHGSQSRANRRVSRLRFWPRERAVPPVRRSLSPRHGYASAQRVSAAAPVAAGGARPLSPNPCRTVVGKLKTHFKIPYLCTRRSCSGSRPLSVGRTEYRASTYTTFPHDLKITPVVFST